MSKIKHLLISEVLLLRNVGNLEEFILFFSLWIFCIFVVEEILFFLFFNSTFTKVHKELTTGTVKILFIYDDACVVLYAKFFLCYYMVVLRKLFYTKHKHV